MASEKKLAAFLAFTEMSVFSVMFECLRVSNLQKQSVKTKPCKIYRGENEKLNLARLEHALKPVEFTFYVNLSFLVFFAGFCVR